MGATDVTWTLDGPVVLDDAVVRAAVEGALALGGRPDAAISVVFVDDATLAELHARHLDDPSETDVMAFELDGGGAEDGPDGELYVSVDRARVVARRRGVSVERELALYVVHGTLHLCGFDDHAPDERARMRAAESDVLGALGFEPDELEHEFGTE